MERRVTTEMEELLNAGAFVGNYTHSLDGKKRVTIPSDWRDAAGNPTLFVLPGVNFKCLYVVTAREMAQRLEKVRAASVANVQAQKFMRDFFSRADRVAVSGFNPAPSRTSSTAERCGEPQGRSPPAVGVR